MKHQPLTIATTPTRNGGEAERVSLPPEEEFARSVLAEQQYLLRAAICSTWSACQGALTTAGGY